MEKEIILFIILQVVNVILSTIKKIDKQKEKLWRVKFYCLFIKIKNV